MVLLLILLLLLAAAAGILGTVVKVALGVALGIVAGFGLIAWFIVRRVRRALYRQSPGWRRVGGSRVEVLERGPDRSRGR